MNAETRLVGIENLLEHAQKILRQIPFAHEDIGRLRCTLSNAMFLTGELRKEMTPITSLERRHETN